MRRLLTSVALLTLFAGACSGGEDAATPSSTTAPPTTAEAPATTTAPTTTEAASPETFCESVDQVNLALDDLARTMLATIAGEPSGAFLLAVENTVATLGVAESLAPPAAAEATALLAQTYTDFEALLFEIDFMPENLPTDDPRASALTNTEFTDAIATITEECA